MYSESSTHRSTKSTVVDTLLILVGNARALLYDQDCGQQQRRAIVQLVDSNLVKTVAKQLGLDA